MTTIDQQVRKLANATGSLNDARRSLEEDFKRSTDSYLTGGTAGWIELDAALRVPLIDAAKREVLLKDLLDQRETIDDIGSPGGEGTEPGGGPPIDRGFWVRAAGLARLDLRLRRLNHGPRAGRLPRRMRRSRASGRRSGKPRTTRASRRRPSLASIRSTRSSGSFAARRESAWPNRPRTIRTSG